MSEGPRTTGKFSQSAHLHGHLQQLARHYGIISMHDMKQLMKWDCIEWPWKEIVKNGIPVYAAFSESEVNKDQESKAIEWCHHHAAQRGVRLVEISDD